MVSTNDVYRKIKEMSQRVANPRPPIMINALAGELLLVREQILPSIAELKKLRLIQSETPAHTSGYVKLTLLGYSVTR